MKKPEIVGYILHVSIYMKCLKHANAERQKVLNKLVVARGWRKEIIENDYKWI